MGRPKGSKNTSGKKTVTRARRTSAKIVKSGVPNFVNSALLSSILSGQPLPEADRVNVVLHLAGAVNQ